jgi:hypothetical protein
MLKQTDTHDLVYPKTARFQMRKAVTTRWKANPETSYGATALQCFPPSVSITALALSLSLVLLHSSRHIENSFLNNCILTKQGGDTRMQMLLTAIT